MNVMDIMDEMDVMDRGQKDKVGMLSMSARMRLLASKWSSLS